MIEHEPGAAERTGVPKSVAHEFVQADKGRNLKKLPQRVLHKDDGGCVSPNYPKRFVW